MEEAGMASVVISAAAFRDRLEAMHLPRLVLTPHLMGRPVGMPGDRERQHEVLSVVLDLLETAEEAGTVVVMDQWETAS
jgi:hypothetical protein